MKSAVIDRIIGDREAILLVGEDQIEKVVSVSCLPEGAKEGMWILLDERDGVVVSSIVDITKTETTEQRIKSKMNRLRQRKKKE